MGNPFIEGKYANKKSGWRLKDLISRRATCGRNDIVFAATAGNQLAVTNGKLPFALRCGHRARIFSTSILHAEHRWNTTVPRGAWKKQVRVASSRTRPPKKLAGRMKPSKSSPAPTSTALAATHHDRQHHSKDVHANIFVYATGMTLWCIVGTKFRAGSPAFPSVRTHGLPFVQLAMW